MGREYLSLPIAEKIGVFGIYAFALSAWLFPDPILALKALVIITLGGLLDAPRLLSAVRRTPLLWVVALTVLYIFVANALASASNPEQAAFHRFDGAHLARLSAFVLVAWFLAGNQQRILIFLVLALVSFVLGRAINFSLPVGAVADGWRANYPMGIGTAIPLGQYAAAACIGTILLAPQLWRRVANTRWRWLFLSVSTALILSLAGIVVIAQSRGVWLAILVILVPILVLQRKRILGVRQRHGTGFAFVIIFAIGISGYSSFGLVKRTWLQETDTYINLLKLGWGAVQSTDETGRVQSVGVRVQMAIFGLKCWTERPIFGHGPGATRILVAERGQDAFKGFGDLHNGYVEMLLRLGLVGSGLLLATVWLTFYAGWRAYRDGRLAPDLFLFLASALALHLLVNVTNFRMLDWDWRFYWLIVGGALASSAFTKVSDSRFSLDRLIARALHSLKTRLRGPMPTG